MKITNSQIVKLVAAVGTAGLVAAGFSLFAPRAVITSSPESDMTVSEAKTKVAQHLSVAEKQQQAEFAEVAANYDFPAGQTLDTSYRFRELESQLESYDSADASNTRVRAEGAIYQEGYFKGSALLRWQCAWMKHAVAAHESKQTADVAKAVGVLEGFKDSPDIELFPDYDAMLKDLVEPLKQGDSAEMKDYIQYNCSF